MQIPTCFFSVYNMRSWLTQCAKNSILTFTAEVHCTYLLQATKYPLTDKNDKNVNIKNTLKTLLRLLLKQNRDGTRSENLGGQVVMRRAAAAWRRLLFCQKLGGELPAPPLPQPLKYIPVSPLSNRICVLIESFVDRSINFTSKQKPTD